MKSFLTSIAASSLLAAVAMAQPLPSYTVTDLGTLPGGNSSGGYGINNSGVVAGCSNLLGDRHNHAVLWNGDGRLIELGTLGGPNSCADGPNAFGEAVVTSTTSKPDPNGEDFLGNGSHLQSLAAIWKDGRLAELPTLPGGTLRRIGSTIEARWSGFRRMALPIPPAQQQLLIRSSSMKP